MTLEDRIKKPRLSLNIYKDSRIPTIYYGHRVRHGEVYLGTIEDAERYLEMILTLRGMGP